MSPKPVRLLLTCAGGATISFLARALASAAAFDVTVFGCDSNPVVIDRSIMADVRVVPPGSDPDYVPAMLALAQTLAIDLIWPGSDEEAMALAAAKGIFEAAGIRLLVSDHACLQLLTDKAAVYERLSAAGIPCPEYRVVHGVEALRQALAMYDFPKHAVVVKPVSGRGGRGVIVLSGTDVVETWIGSGARETRLGGAELPDALTREQYPGGQMVMPIMGGPVYDADVCAVRGRPIGISLRKRHNPTGIPYRGNLVFRDAALEQACGRIAEALGLDSLHDYDLMTDRDGNIRLLEVNPRPSGSFISTVAAGSNLAEVAIAAKLDFDLPYRPVDGAIEVTLDGGALHTRPVT